MGIQTTGHAGKEGPNTEGRYLIAGCVEAHGFSGHLVVGDRQEATPMGRVEERPDGVHGQRRRAEGPKQIAISRHSSQPSGAAHRVHILENDANNFPKTQRHNGQVVALEPEGGCSDCQTRHRGQQARSNEAHWEKDPLQENGIPPQPGRHHRGQHGRGVRTHGHETGVSQRELARKAVDEIEAGSQHHTDTHPHHHVQKVGIDRTRTGRGQPCKNQGCEQPALGNRKRHG